MQLLADFHEPFVAGAADGCPCKLIQVFLHRIGVSDQIQDGIVVTGDLVCFKETSPLGIKRDHL